MIFKYNFDINLPDITPDKKIKNKSLLQALENISSKHSDFVQNGVGDIFNNGETWILLDWKMQVLDRPKYGDELEVHTWVRETTKLYSNRDFVIYVNGEKKVIASARWILVYNQTFRPMRITEEIISKYEPELNKNVFGEAEIEKLEEQENYDEEMDYAVRKSDIDLNNHVHNLNYIDMAYEILDVKEEFASVRISYKKEIKIEDKIKIMSKYLNNKYFIAIKNVQTGIIHALIELN